MKKKVDPSQHKPGQLPSRWTPKGQASRESYRRWREAEAGGFERKKKREEERKISRRAASPEDGEGEGKGGAGGDGARGARRWDAGDGHHPRAPHGRRRPHQGHQHPPRLSPRAAAAAAAVTVAVAFASGG